MLALSLGFVNAIAERPNWSINPVDYNYSMSYVGVVYLDYELQADENSMIAAFVGDELRGVASPVYSEETQSYTFFLMVYSNTDNQTLIFKYYDSLSDKTVNFDETGTFSADEIIGSPFNPVVWANPALTEADLLSFELEGQVRSEIIDFDVNVVVEEDFDITQAIAIFEVSGGAIVTVNDEIQVSGVSENDFSEPLTYTINSADQSAKNLYTVKIIINNLGSVNASKIVSPNGDGVNDVWIVEDVEKFKESTFYIMDSFGHKVYESVGYDNSWDARYNGTVLPTGTCYYLIEVPYGKALSGTISIIR